MNDESLMWWTGRMSGKRSHCSCEVMNVVTEGRVVTAAEKLVVNERESSDRHC